MDYRAAGVDVEAGRAFVNRIKAGVEATHRPEVVGGPVSYTHLRAHET